MQLYARIGFETHAVAIFKNIESSLDDIIYCFKHDHEQCSWESFKDKEAATEFIFKPFDKWGFRVVIDE